MAVEVRFFRIDEKQKLLDAIDRLWKHNHIYVRKPEVLEHLCLKTPYVKAYAGEGNYSFMGLWDGDEVVGLFGPIPQKVNVFGKEYVSETSTTWIVDHDHRLYGMDFLDYLLEHQHPYMMNGIGISPTSYKLAKLVGDSVIPNLPRWIAVNDLKETVRVLLPNAETKPYMPMAHKCSVSSKYHVIEGFLQDAWDEYYHQVFAPKYIGVVRDAEFLHWRYEESPILKYKFLSLLDKKDKYHGLAVVRIESIMDKQYKIGRVLEFISFEADAAVELGNAVLDADHDVLMWDFYCLSSITAFGLESVGFRKLPDWMDKVMMPTRFQPVDHEHLQIPLNIKLDKKIKKELQSVDTDKWYMTKGDADQDRAN